MQIHQAFWFSLCYAAPRWADAFAFSFGNQIRHGTPSRLCETSSSASKSCVVVDSVVRCIDDLYPPQGLEQRIALSRKDGYWPFISAGEDPPQELVYGEFDISLLQETLERSRALVEKDDEDIVFCDMGSGTGRVVLATAALHPNWKVCRGIELLESIHEEAVEKVQNCRSETDAEDQPPIDNNDEEDDTESGNERNGNEPDSDGNASDSETATSESDTVVEFSLASENGSLPLAPIELECGSFTDPYGSFCDADIVFCFSTAMPRHVLIDLARSIGRQSLPGTIVVTTDYQLPAGGDLEPLPDDPEYPYGKYEIELVDTLSGDCNAVGGESTVFVQRVVKSVGTGVHRVQPPLPVGEIAYRAIQYMEESDPKIFLRQVSNQMAFLGFPDSWRPNV